MPLAGAQLLLRMYERVAASNVKKEIIVATTTESEDDEIEKLCDEKNIRFFRGHPKDLLDRHYRAAIESSADIAVKIPSDCPLICPEVIDRVLNFYIERNEEYDFVSNLHPATYPDGMDVEVIPIDILETAWKEAEKDFEREHTTPFIWEHPERFRLGNVEWETGLDYSMSHRFTVDYPDDYELISKIYEELYSEDHIFDMNDILQLLERKPELMKINELHNGTIWYRNYLDELKTIDSKHKININRDIKRN